MLKYLIIRGLIWIALGYAGGWIAARKGYPPRLGIAIAIFLGPVALLIGWLLPPTSTAQEEDELEKQISREIADKDRMKQCPDCKRDVAYHCRICPRCEHRFLLPQGNEPRK